MDKIWLKSYEKDIATQIDSSVCSSLVEWFEQSVEKHQD